MSSGAAAAASSPEPEATGASKSPGRSREPKAKPSGYSYAAIGLLKDNLGAKKAADGSSKGSEDTAAASPANSASAASAAAAGAGPGSLKASINLGATLKGDIAAVTQRTGLSKENALLRAELEVLRQQNQELSSRLKATEGKLGGPPQAAAGAAATAASGAAVTALAVAAASPPVGARHAKGASWGDGGVLLQEVEALRASLERAELERARAAADAEAAGAQLQAARAALGGLTLSADEIEAVALSCCWLARYWGLAASFGLLPEISAAQAAHWKAVAPPTSSMFAAARAAVRDASSKQGSNSSEAAQQQQQDGQKQQQQQQQVGQDGEAATEACSSNKNNAADALAAVPDHYQLWWKRNRSSSVAAAPGTAAAAADTDAAAPAAGGGGEEATPARDGAAMRAPIWPCTADVAAVELALRRLNELGVEAAVTGALAEQARARRAVVQLPQAGTAPQGMTPVALGPEEAEEVRFQAARLAYLWARAAAAGLEAPMAAERAEYWAWRAERKAASLRDYTDVRHGFQELRLRGVEQQLWELRQLPQGVGAAAAAAAAGDERFAANSTAVPPAPLTLAAPAVLQTV